MKSEKAAFGQARVFQFICLHYLAGIVLKTAFRLAGGFGKSAI
jgi:hypothetical protein